MLTFQQDCMMHDEFNEKYDKGFIEGLKYSTSIVIETCRNKNIDLKLFELYFIEVANKLKDRENDIKCFVDFFDPDPKGRVLYQHYNISGIDFRMFLRKD